MDERQVGGRHGIDLVALSWCIPEIRESLARACAELDRHLSAEAGSTGHLKNARIHLHQAHGALQVAEVAGVSVLTQEAESIIERGEREEVAIDTEAVAALKRALAAVTEYLEDLQAGSTLPPVVLFSFYRALLQLRQAERIDPADLYFPDLSIQPPALFGPQLSADGGADTGVNAASARREFERGLLGFLRGDDNPGAIRTMHGAMERMQAANPVRHARAFFWMALALLDALKHGALQTDLYAKRLVARVNIQARRSLESQDPVADRMLKDLLFQLARAQDSSPIAAEVRRHYRLAGSVPADFERVRYGLTDPALMRRAREATQLLKKSWEKIVRGSHKEGESFSDAAADLCGAFRELPFAGLSALAAVIATVPGALASVSMTNDALSLEVATALLFVEEALDGGVRSDPAYDSRAGQLGERLRQVLDRPAGFSESAPQWLVDISRKASGRITLGVFVNELNANLRNCEQSLDAYFRDASAAGQLSGIKPLLTQSVGVFRALGFSDAARACLAILEDVDGIVGGSRPVGAADHQRIANNLSALGFFVESLLQPAGQADVFRFDDATREFVASAEERQSVETDLQVGVLPVGGGEMDLTLDASLLVPVATGGESAESRIAAERQAIVPWLMMLAAAPQAPDVHENLQRCLAGLERDAVLVDDPELKRKASGALQDLARLRADRVAPTSELMLALSQLAGVAVPSPASDAGRPGASAAVSVAEVTAEAGDDDAELLEIFLLEADEVLTAIAESLVLSRSAPADPAPLTTIRRAFHTLKGSSRMVGLTDFGDAGWAFEQVLNKWLADEQPGNGRLYRLVEAGHELFSLWVARLHQDPAARLDASALISRCEAIRDGREAGDVAGGARPAETQPAATEMRLAESSAAGPVAADPRGSPAHVAEAHVAEAALPDRSVEDLERFAEAVDAFEMPVEPVEPVELTDAVDGTAAADAPADPAAVAAELGDFAELAASFDAWINAPIAEPAGQADTVGTAEPDDGTGTVESAAAAESVETIEAVDPVDPADPIEPVQPMVRVAGREIDPELFAIFNAEAAQIRQRLDTGLSDWHERREVEAPEELVRALHSLVGTSRHVGLLQLRAIAEPAEQLLLNHAKVGRPMPADHLAQLYAAIASIQSMLDQFAQRNDPQRDEVSERSMRDLAYLWSKPETMAKPADEDRSVRGEALRKKAAEVLGAARQSADDDHDPLRGLVDEIDADLGPIFFEETDDLMPKIDQGLREWRAQPAGESAPAGLMRLLHTIKGSARMAGAMRFGQMVHEMETRVEEAIGLPEVPETLVDHLLAQYDQAFSSYERLKDPATSVTTLMPAAGLGEAPPADGPAGDAPKPPAADATVAAGHADPAPGLPAAVSPDAPAGRIATQRDPATASRGKRPAPVLVPTAAMHAELDRDLITGAAQAAAAAQQVIRVRADLLDKMVSESGEVSVARARLDSEMGVIRQALAELTENVNRLRAQLREIEIQADNQIQAQIASSKDSRAEFDPLEFDRYTRFQELTRMLAESVNDVATVQQNAMRAVDSATQDLARQGQVSRSLQQNLMRIRMVQFSTISDRLYRVVRQAGKDADKRVVLEIKGAQAEIDRGVLERMAAPMEHLLRNSVAHGIETRDERSRLGKPETGELTIEVRQEGNEVIMSFADDGAGLDYARIETRARERGLIADARRPSERELAQMIFTPGFSTASEVTALAGRGVGMDVVRAEVAAMGGRIDIDATPGAGTRFTIHLPVSLAVSQVVLLGVDTGKFAVQAALVEQILQVRPEVLAAAYETHAIECDGEPVPMYFLGSLLELPNVRPLAQRQSPVVVVRAGTSRIALHVDRVVPNQEVVIKNVGPQLARLTGIAGATVLGNGDIVLILNPVQLALARSASQAGEGDTAHFTATEIPATATVMVVDDSVTVRKVTQRLLVREGFTVLLAKDGVDALRQLQDVVPDMMLVDIEMPRMDGFDLTKNVRSTPRLQDIPIIMITSRTADKHRSHAMSLGVDVFLGKPYPEDELLRHVRGFAAQRRPVAAS